MAATEDTLINNIGELKAALKRANKCWVWCRCYSDDGEYLPISKSSLLRCVGADTANDGAHGGKPNSHPFKAVLRSDGDLYVD